MDDVKYLLIGGGVGAFNAAKRICKADPDARTMLIGDEALPPYDLPPLSKEFLRGLKNETDIVYESVAALQERGLELKLSTRVVELDVGRRLAVLDTNERIAFAKAFLSPGARPVQLSVPGTGLKGVHYLRTVRDATALKRSVTAGARAVIVGAGFIGLEVAASLRMMGLDVTVVEAMPRIWPRFADEMLANYVQTICELKGIAFRLNDTVSAIAGGSRVQSVLTASGAVIPADLVCVGVGVRPNTELAAAAGLKVDDGIWVDDRMRTSAEHIYAGGDAANYLDPFSHKRRRVEHWGHAEYCGQLAGMNMTGRDAKYDFVSYVWSDIFDLHFESAGDETEPDYVLVRGDMSTGHFLTLFLRDERLSGYIGINADPKEFVVLRRLIRGRKKLADKVAELTSTHTDLRTLL